MILYLLIILPIITTFVLWKFFKHKVVIWEYLIPFIASIICIVSVRLISISSRTFDIEYWGGYVTSVNFYEDWNEYIHMTCTASCGKNCTYTYDCSYVQNHPQEFVLNGSNNETEYISRDTYEWVKNKFGGHKQFIELNRHFHSKDGDLYTTNWKGEKEKFLYWATEHSYTNKVQASRSIFNFEEISEDDVKQYKLFEYPSVIANNVPTILGDSSAYINEIDNREYKWLNATLGKKKELRLWILLYHNMPYQTFQYQKSYWKGGNQNEFVICIDINEFYDINWCDVFSWTENERLKLDIRNYILDQKKLDLDKASPFIYDKLDKDFVRKHFEDFDYLSIDPSNTEVLVCFLIVLILNIVGSVYVIYNDIEEN